MVHQRPLSFTDDSTNVTHIDELPKTNKPQAVFTSGLEPATNLVKLRRIQSASYQRLFQSESLPMRATWPIMCKAIHEMAHWYSSVLNQVSQVLRNHARCEILYSNILMLTPPNWVDSLPAYGKFLVLQYALEYSSSIYSAISDMSRGFGFYTSHDLLRASFVAQRFVSLLRIDYKLFFSTSGPPPPPATLGSVAPPTLTISWPSLKSPTFAKANVSGQLTRIYDSLERFETFIAHLSSKYGYTDPLHDHRVNSSSLKQTLENWTRSSEQGSSILHA